MKRLYEATSGNVIGIVEEPPQLDFRKSYGSQAIVKMGVIDPNGDLPSGDARIVIEKIRMFVETLPKQENGHARKLV